MDGIGYPVDHSLIVGALLAAPHWWAGQAPPLHATCRFLESVYEKCLMIELRKAGIRAEHQKPITVHYEGEAVGDFTADILVDDCVIVELKSVRRIIKAHEVQLVNYLVATGKEVGLILNFGETKVEVKRKIRTLEA